MSHRSNSAGPAASPKRSRPVNGHNRVLRTRERVKLQEKEFFSQHDYAIAAAPTAAARKRLIADLKTSDPALREVFEQDLRRAEGTSVLLRNSGRFPLAGRGDVNTYAVFAELMANGISPTGRVGTIVPTGIATDDTTKYLFGDLVENSRLVYSGSITLQVSPMNVPSCLQHYHSWRSGIRNQLSIQHLMPTSCCRSSTLLY